MGDKYLGFFRFENDDDTVIKVKAARRLAVAILDYFEEHGISTDELVVVGCDGTVLNTGHKVSKHLTMSS